MTAGALHDRTIVVTRPQAQAAGLCRAIEGLGGTALCFPVLGIGPVEDRSVFAAMAPRLGEFDLAFFVSPNAVNFALDWLLAHAEWPAQLQVSTVGKGSERALEGRGFTKVIAPAAGFDSEAVLDLPAFSAEAICGRRVLILRGDGGRDLLGETLIERGAQVEYLTCYHRFCPASDAEHLLGPVRHAEVDALLLTSSEGVRNLATIVGAQGLALLRRLPIFVPHLRIAAQCRALGMDKICVTDAGDEGLLRALVRHFG